MGIVGNQKLAAIITHVWGTNMVNLAVLDANGKAFSRTSVIFSHSSDDELKSDIAYCEWLERGEPKWSDSAPINAAIHGDAPDDLDF
ncbi:hypothetical protein [Methylocystis heyeri]|uniref:Uncharacterized protein n=1 Tax=Methylocystis heyeri TaxID=391905 RepID=A0A6B8KHZ5_9HYPH|nr:hypothetical protein [Methylocystis heyeri]QGM46110.1 hypothetical protein H2LOC_010625 [Methylocystis heyeri]